jgi:hypothetical protein
MQLNCRKIMFGEHSLKRMFEQGLLPGDILEVIKSGEIIKEYADDKPYPSCLMLKFVRNRPIHIVVANDREKAVCFIVTAYEPDPALWSNNFKTKINE